MRREARNFYDELVELGGIPARPWADFTKEDLTPQQRAEWDGDRHLMNLYCTESGFWRHQLKLWKRFMKRRKMDNKPDLGEIDRRETITDFVAYLRGHLKTDVQDRAEMAPWLYFTTMSVHRDFLEDILDVLPAAEAVRRELDREAGEDTAPEAPEVTRDGLKKEYSIPERSTWYDLWERLAEQLVREQSEPESEPKSPPRKRERDEAEEQGEETRPPKRIDLGSEHTGEVSQSVEQDEE